MADKMTKTISSISLEKQSEIMTKSTSSHTPNTGEAQIVTRLAENITESYRNLTQKQQNHKDLTNQLNYHQQHLKRIHNESSNNAKLLKPKTTTDEWQEVCSSNNKLKRKKTLSASLTSVTDSVNQEKRTRIEGMQLNCRGKLHIRENINATAANTSASAPPSVNPPATPVPSKTDRLNGKPPLPPSTKNNNAESKLTVNPPPRLKRKLQENVHTIQKLNALTEQLRLEINELKSSLTTEKGAVRVLRAQNECEARKWKSEVKKLQNAVELLKKAGANKKCDTTTNNENLPQAAMGGLVNYEIQRLTNEINNLKEANKALEEKKVINCDADRRKAADIRELKDSYEIRLTQIQKSAKIEISRLLEEIKTKERNIGQLKKDLQILQNCKNTSRNATTFNTNQTNKTTTSNAKNQINKKPKNSSCNERSRQNEDSSKETAATTKNTDRNRKAENSNEISKLKNIELINNTKNATTNLQKTTKVLNIQYNKEKETEIVESNNENTITTIVHKHLKALEIPDLNANAGNDGHSCCTNLMQTKHEPLLLTTGTQTTDTPTAVMTATATTQTPDLSAATFMTSSIACDETDHFDEQHITQELTQHLENKAIQHAKDDHHCHHRRHHHHQHQHHHHHHHNHNHNNHSDSDSALSSAPTSISPQPPASGEEPTDLWQTMRSYSHDIEKLQKEVDLLQKQNEELKQELNLAKDQIIELETTAMENANNSKIPQLMKRIKYLEDQEHELQAEANDLREQNELLEFRILELEETHDKWSLQNHTSPTSESSESMQTTTVTNAPQNLWSCPLGANPNNNKPDPFEILFGSKNHNSAQLDSGIISPQSQHHQDDLIDLTNDELCRRLGDLLKKSSFEEHERHCLQQVLNLVQQLDALTPRSGPNSLNATSSSDEASSLDLVKSRVSDYSSASSTSTSSARSTYDNCSANSTKVSGSNSTSLTTPPRIVATVQPYNSTVQVAPHNTPTESPRKLRCQPWQTNSLSESGVFVESDFYSDISENNVCTQTDFEESGISIHSTHHIFNSPTKKVPVQQQNSSNLTDKKRLQYYKERVEILEGKLLIYESSGDVQAKRLAERLQREIQLEKEVNELRDRVEFLEGENSTLEEEKCEFEEAENDTRLRLQRLEVELEILSQRNVELEMSREAQSAKYKDCHSECLILRDDLAASETQIRHLEEDKQKAKENFEFLYNTLPLLLIFNTYCTLAQTENPNYQVANIASEDMGNQNSTRLSGGGSDTDLMEKVKPCRCHERELQYLKDEVKCLRHKIKELNSRHYAAMESADSHWLDLEREYKEREEQFLAKETCLKQKIQKLQDCLRDDARSANEKICQLEEAEQALKTCFVKVSKEHQKLQEDHQLMLDEYESFKEQHEQVLEQQKPLAEALECEKKRHKCLLDELIFMRILQQETESQGKKELDSVRDEMFDLKKDFLHIEVTNGELREEVATLELQIQNLEKAQQESEEKIRCLTDEIRTKDEICQKLEKRLERTEGYCLADELGDSPSKRFKREEVTDLRTASTGLGQALKHMGECERMLPTQKQFKTIARDVKKLADTLLQSDAPEEENELIEKSVIEMVEKVTEGSVNESRNDSQSEVIRESVNESPVKLLEAHEEGSWHELIQETANAAQAESSVNGLQNQLTTATENEFQTDLIQESLNASQRGIDVNGSQNQSHTETENQFQTDLIEESLNAPQKGLSVNGSQNQSNTETENQFQTDLIIESLNASQKGLSVNGSQNLSIMETVNESQTELTKTVNQESTENQDKGNEKDENLSYNIEAAVSSTPDEQSLQSEINEANPEETTVDPMQEHNSEANVVVGMALMPQIHVDENMLPSSSDKKAICEVPSEMRKLAEPINTVDGPEVEQSSCETTQTKRCAKRRMNHSRVSSFYLKVNHIVSRLFSNQEHQDDYELDANESEILQRNISYGSFPTLREQTNESIETTTRVSVGCETKIDTKNAATTTFVKKRDLSIQVNDEIAVELLMECMPKNLRSFLELLKSSSSNTGFRFNSSLFNMKICLRWLSDSGFRQGLVILASCAPLDSNNGNSVSLESYEAFVAAMNCLHVLTEMFKPKRNAMLVQIEKEIDERLMVFHSQKKESEFYCSVYYPVERKTDLKLAQLVKK